MKPRSGEKKVWAYSGGAAVPPHRVVIVYRVPPLEVIQ